MKRGLGVIVGIFILIFSLSSFVSAISCLGTLDCSAFSDISSPTCQYLEDQGYCSWDGVECSGYTVGSCSLFDSTSKITCETYDDCTWDESTSSTSGDTSKGATGSTCLINSECASGQCGGAVAGACSGNYNLKVNWLGNPFDWMGWVSSVPCEDCHDAGQIGYFVEGSSWYKYTCVKNKFIFCTGSRWAESSKTYFRSAYATVSCDSLSQSACTPSGCSWTGTSGHCKAASVAACVPATNPTLSGICGTSNCGTVANGTCGDVTCGSCSGLTPKCYITSTSQTCVGCLNNNDCTDVTKPNCVNNKCVATACKPADNPTLSGVCGDKKCGTATNGSCGTVTCGTCSNSHGTTSCPSGLCVPVCSSGYANCDSDTTNGCETQLGTDTNCASCGNACTTAGQTCQSGICKTTSTTKCTSGQSCTNGACSCDDGKDCTTDTCSSSGSCAHTNKEIASPCTDDGKSYTIDLCSISGECLHTPSACATDNNECTKDYYSANGVCTHTNEETGKPCKVSNTECKNYICSSGACVVQSTKSNCVVTPTIDWTPRVAFSPGKSSMHTENGVWTPDRDGIDFDRFKSNTIFENEEAARIAYCIRSYGNSPYEDRINASKPYKLETITGWRDQGDIDRPIQLPTLTAQTYTCVHGSLSLCGNKEVNPGENCSSCGEDVKCASGKFCTWGECSTEATVTLKENGANCSSNSECKSGNCSSTKCSAQVYTSIWNTNSTINAGLPDIGALSRPTVFYKDSNWYLISGGMQGKFYGFVWNGTQWVTNSVIVNGLPDIGGYSAPFVFYKDSNWYLISGEFNGKFYGFVWNGTKWLSNSTITQGLPDVPNGDFGSTLAVFYKDSNWYLISEDRNSKFYGYSWNGNKWIANSIIINGLPDLGNSATPMVFYKDSNWYLISGMTNGRFYGYSWNGTQWKVNLIINASISSVEGNSAPFVFNTSSTDWYLISGSAGGEFYGYKYYIENGTNIAPKENGLNCSLNSECISGNCTNSICLAICTPVTNPCGGKNCGTVTNGTCGNVTCGSCSIGQNCNSTGQCAVSSCSAGYANCDSNTANGCEIQLGTATHCANCTNICASGQSCVNNICKIPEDNLTLKRIAFWEGKVNQHTENGVWTADPNEISDVNVDKLNYCKKFYLNTISVKTYQVETIPSWKSVGSTGAPISAPKQSYECVQSGGATTSSCELGCSLSNGRCVQIGYRQSVKYCSPNGDFVNQIADDAICDNNFECTSNFCVERKCISGTLIQKILSWFRDLFSPR